VRSWIASGCRRRASARRSAVALFASLLAAGSGAGESAPAGSLDLATLMRYFAESRGVEADYREEKTLPLLVDPLVSEGTLYFAPPDRLVRFTRSPEQGSMLVKGDRLRIEDALGVEELDLGAQPTARQIVEQLLVLFRGDLPALEREYEVGFDSEGDRWQLTLVPRGLRVRQLIREISMQGHAGALDEMIVHGAEGEQTRTTHPRVVTDRAFSAAEQAQLFPEEGSPRPLEAPSPPVGGAPGDAAAPGSPEAGPTP
jgi:hypothetical protein